MAKDTEKLIRQLSLISYLMAERRPVTATEIRRDVEGYSDMTEDAFARRFYADRAELDALGIHLSVDKPADGFSEQENYSLAPEAFHLPAIAFTDDERAALQTALTLLGGEFAYAEPLRLALQQITWGRPSPLGSDLRQTIGLGITASAGARSTPPAWRRSTPRSTAASGSSSSTTRCRATRPPPARSTPTTCSTRAASSTSSATRTSAATSACSGSPASAARSRTRPRPSTTSSAPPTSTRASTPGASRGSSARRSGAAQVWVSDDVSWYVERQFGAYGELHGNVFTTRYANPRLLISWALGLREHARVEGPAELADDARERIDRIIELHRGEPLAVPPLQARAAADGEPPARTRSAEGTIRPERFARLVTLASVLIAAGRENHRLAVDDVCQRLNMTPQELREDIAVLNVVNFGGGAYVIYAEVLPSGEIEVDPEPYSDTFDRPARLLPIEAKALVAAIDLLNLAQPELGAAREKVVEALGHDPVEEGLQIASPTVADEVAHTVERAVHDSRLLRFEYWSGEQRFSERRVEPYALFNGMEAWYVAAYDLDKDRLQHFRLDRIKRATALDEHFERRENLDPIADVGGWPRTGTVEGSRIARVWIAPEQARWAREKRTVVAELEDGAVVVELPFKGIDFLVKEILKEAGDAAVLEPADARDAVLAAAERLPLAERA